MTHAWQKGVQVGLTMVVAAAITGYFVGMRQTRMSLRTTPPVAHASTGGDGHAVPSAVRYSDGPRLHLGPNRHWPTRSVALQPPEGSIPKTPPGDEEKRLALAQRAARRAFDGAPPIIPHPIMQHGTDACLVCHEHGARIGNLVATKMSHPLLGNCTQCHIEGGGSDAALDSLFAGLAPQRGERAFAGAPPQVPHPTAMRSDCLSCHGPTGLAALRCTHPERQNCFQCHVRSSQLDLPPFLQTE
jgi:cytochrome c-type protein NapB